MEQTNNKKTDEHTSAQQEKVISIDPAKMDNEVLKRLIGEINFEKETRLHSYNRTHNRHNRGR